MYIWSKGTEFDRSYCDQNFRAQFVLYSTWRATDYTKFLSIWYKIWIYQHISQIVNSYNRIITSWEIIHITWMKYQYCLLTFLFAQIRWTYRRFKLFQDAIRIEILLRTTLLLSCNLQSKVMKKYPRSFAIKVAKSQQRPLGLLRTIQFWCPMDKRGRTEAISWDPAVSDAFLSTDLGMNLLGTDFYSKLANYR